MCTKYGTVVLGGAALQGDVADQTQISTKNPRSVCIYVYVCTCLLYIHIVTVSQLRVALKTIPSKLTLHLSASKGLQH